MCMCMCVCVVVMGKGVETMSVRCLHCGGYMLIYVDYSWYIPLHLHQTLPSPHWSDLKSMVCSYLNTILFLFLILNSHKIFIYASYGSY